MGAREELPRERLRRIVALSRILLVVGPVATRLATTTQLKRLRANRGFRADNVTVSPATLTSAGIGLEPSVGSSPVCATLVLVSSEIRGPSSCRSVLRG